MISAIVAVDENWGIGYNDQLLERIPDDLKHFKELTTDKVVVMGRKTWDSLPKKPLENRINVVISNSMFPFKGAYKWDIIKNLSICMKMDYAISYIRYINTDNDVFVIGGGTIYKELLPYCDRVYITKIYKTHENVDTYFPKLDDLEWKIVHESEILTFNDLQYQFLTYDRIN